jgi:tetratricopeptide (TPR) repeat protein
MNPLELVVKTLHSFGEKELAFDVLDSFGKNSDNFHQYDEVAKCFFELKNLKKAIEYGEKSLNFISSFQEELVIKKNLINAYNQSNLPEKSLSLIKDLNKKIKYDHELILEESFAYSALNKKDKSNQILLELLKQQLPEEIKKKAYHNLSSFYFRKDDLKNGLKHFLKTGEQEAYKNRKISKFKRWEGEDIKGSTLIIDNQCGAGDEVMHIRFMHNLKELGINPIWVSTRGSLVELFNYNGYNALYSWDEPDLSSDCYWVYSLALPYYLNTSIEELWKGPYIQTIPDLDKKWNWIKKDNKFKIGLFGQSSSGFEQNSFRSIDLNEYMKVLSERNFSLYSLQTAFDKQNIENYSEINTCLITPDRDFADTFSIIKNLDLIITSCSFTAHAAASMGKEVCVFVPIMEYYVWTSSTNKSWWYGDNVHMFKQKNPRSWDEPLEELKNFLNEIS